MFKVDNELENANVPRTIRFTESLFERLDEAAGQKITATGRKTAAVIFCVQKPYSSRRRVSSRSSFCCGTRPRT